MPVPRIFLTSLLSLVLLGPLSAGAAEAPSDVDGGTPAAPSGSTERAPAEVHPTTKASTLSPADRDAIKRELMDEVRRELEKSKADLEKKKQEIDAEVSYASSEADARNYDISTLREIQQQVNLLQIHGYFRVRGNEFNNASLGRGADPTGRYLFPYLTTPVPPPNFSLGAIGAGDMRLRLEPVLRVSDFITVHGQFDILDNVVFGGDPLTEPFFPATAGSNNVSTVTPSVLANQIRSQAIDVKRVWAEVTVPFGHISIGRMGYHWGEGMFYNDGNCLDCDYGNTFDRLLISSNPVASHVFTVTADMLGQGVVTDAQATQAYGRPLPINQLAGAYRFGFQVQRILSDFERKRRADNGEWSVQYGLMGAYRMQAYETVPEPTPAGFAPQKIDAQFGEGDAYFQVERRKLRLAGEFAIFGGQEGNRLFTDGLGNTSAIIGQPLNFLQGAALLRGKYFFLKQDSLYVGLDLGWASGDKQPGMGIRTYAAGSGPNGTTVRGDVDGAKYNCNASTCINNDITNFRMNPDFRVDELMWRNIFTQVSGAYFVRGYAGFKPGGRASGGADDYGLDLNLNAIYSQAVYASETPSGRYTPLGFEIDANATFTTKEGLFAGFTAGFLIPLAGMDNYNVSGMPQSASLGQIYRGFVGVRF